LRAGRLTVLRQWIRQGANQYLEITLRQAARLEKRSSCRGVRAALVPSGLHYAKLFAALRKSNSPRSKDYAERVGLDPALYAGHSMRAGFLTSAAKRGA